MRTLTLRAGELRGNRLEFDVDGRTLWYEFGGVVPDRPPFEAAAVALMPYAMAEYDELRIADPIDRELVAGLEEFRDFWSLWRPQLFRPIRITADTPTDDRRQVERGAIAAFSGGVDASHLLIANATGALGVRSLPIRTAVMLHGFDIPWQDTEAFTRAVSRAQPILAEHGVPLATVRTNWRDFCRVITMSAAAGVAGALHLHSDGVSHGLMASDEQYHREKLPWGTNSTSNPMLSSSAFRIRTDGSGTSRTDKCALVGRYEQVRRNVRVCGDGDGANCGTCEKCVRTKLNFLAAGVGEVPALGPVTADQARGLRPRTQVQLEFLREIAEHDLPEDVRAAVRRALRRNVLWLQVRPHLRRVKWTLQARL